MKMLIVDDKEENLYMLEALLKGSGYEVVSAINGVEALERLQKDTFDMIISDILMPRMDGFQLCRECKSDNRLKKIPFVFYTATYTEKKDEEFGLSLGALRYLIKPMEPESLLEIIENILEDYKKDLLVPTELPVEKEEVVYLKGYSERLIKKLDRKVIQLDEANKTLEQRTYDMGERIKELNCMYGVATSIRKRETLEEVFRDVTALIPPAWQYPEITRARLRFNEAEYVSEPFEETEWKQSSDIMVGGEPRGSVEVYYLASRPEADEGPFLKEEGELINGITRALSEAVEHKRAEEALLLQSEIITNMTEGVYLIRAEDGIIVYTNPAFERMFGYGPNEMVGKHVTIVNAPSDKDPEETARKIIEIIDKTGKWHGEICNIKKDGTTFWCYAHVTEFDHPEYGRSWVTVHTDITERKRAEEDLRESEERYRQLFATVSDAIVLFDNETHQFLDVNQRAEELYGYTRDEFLKLIQLDISAEPEASDLAVHETLAGYLEHVPLSYHKKKDGTVFPVEVSIGVFTLGSREVVCAVIRDITERKQAEEALRESQEFAKNIIDSSLDMIIAVDNKRRITEFNHAAEDAFGYHREEVIGKHANLLYADPKEGLAVHKQTIVGGHHVQEILNRHRNGKTFPSLLSSSVLRDSSGEIVGVMGVSRDITERKLAEETLQKAHDKLEQRVEERTADLAHSISLLKATIESTADGILAMDLDQNIKAFNQKCIELWKVPESVIKAGDMDKLRAYAADQLADPQAFMTKIEELFSRPEEEDFSIFIFKDGRICEQYTTPQWMREQIIGRVLSFRDITERKHAEEELKQAKEEAEVATQAKSDFLASMSHELRTPLNAIIGFSEILSDKTFGELNEKQLKYTNHVLTSGRHLLALINDILDLSKVEAGKMELERSTVAVKSLLDDSLVMIKEKAFIHRISIDLRIPDELSGLKLQADERKLKQIMFNLLSNAVKFTPDGGAITVESRQEKDDLIVAVSDTGIGIEPEDLERVFGEFEQIDSSHARQQQGTGLGLALTRKMVELHGGRIWAESEGEGKGSTFTFRIPIETDE